jgi:hypothetical protein
MAPTKQKPPGPAEKPPADILPPATQDPSNGDPAGSDQAFTGVGPRRVLILWACVFLVLLALCFWDLLSGLLFR